MRSSHSATLALTVVGALGSACGAGDPAPPPRDARAAVEAAELESLRERAEAQAERSRELESRLALAQAEARDLREGLGRASAASSLEAVRIGSDAAPVSEPGELAWDEEAWEEPESDGPRPVLRLHGRPVARSDVRAPLSLPPAPAGTPERLPVAPLPGDDEVAALTASSPAAPAAAARPSADPDPVETRYRAALVLLRDRRFREAAEALSAIVAQHGSHARLPDALYWSGVAHYADRRYERALAAFRRVSERHRDSDRAPDAMWKMGMCHQRMGDLNRARAMFERVRREFPNSVAARLASREDAS